MHNQHFVVHSKGARSPPHLTLLTVPWGGQTGFSCILSAGYCQGITLPRAVTGAAGNAGTECDRRGNWGSGSPCGFAKQCRALLWGQLELTPSSAQWVGLSLSAPHPAAHFCTQKLRRWSASPVVPFLFLSSPDLHIAKWWNYTVHNSTATLLLKKKSGME